MSELSDFVGSISNFYTKSAVDQLLILAWHAEVRDNRMHVNSAYLNECFRGVGIDPPNVSLYLTRLAQKKPPQLIREKSGYRLSGAVRRAFDSQLGGDPTILAVAKSLAELPTKLPDLAERNYLIEALNCYRVKAYRATIVMVWNLAFDHFVNWILLDAGRLKFFNDGILSKYPKKSITCLSRADFFELKESETIEVGRVSGLLDKNTAQILKEKLGRRNMAAHPSGVIITQHQADDMITDLISNVILKFV